MVDRAPVVTAEELDSLEPAEVLEGYMDGLRDPIHEPGDNRSKAYWHGWRNAANDKAKTADAAQLALVKDLRANNRLGPGFYPRKSER